MSLFTQSLRMERKTGTESAPMDATVSQMTHRNHGRIATTSRKNTGKPDRLVYAFYYEKARNRLFICYSEIQAVELRRLCNGLRAHQKRIVEMSELDVQLVRDGEGFSEEIALAKSTP